MEQSSARYNTKKKQREHYSSRLENLNILTPDGSKVLFSLYFLRLCYFLIAMCLNFPNRF